MKIRKSLLSLAVSMIMVLSTITVFPSNTTNEVVLYSAFAYPLYGNPNQTTQKTDLYGNSTVPGTNYWIRNDAVDAEKPQRKLYYKFDVSSYINAGYQIDGAYLLGITGSTTVNNPLFLYDCPDNDLVTGDNYLTVPSHDTTYFAETNTLNLTPISTVDYPRDAKYSTWNNLVNITDYVNEKISSGSASFTFVIYPKYVGANACFTEPYVLYLKLGSNTPPRLSLDINGGLNVQQGTPFTVSATATDDSSVANVQFYIDGVLKGTVTEANENNYTFSAKIDTFGPHVIKAVATDDEGKSTTVTKTINVLKLYDCIDFNEFAYTLWGDSTQTNQQYNYNWVLMSGQSDLSTPKRPLYYKFDVSDAVPNGYTFKTATLMLKTTADTGTITLYDCPDNTATLTGAVYNTVPAHNTTPFKTFSLSTKTTITEDNYPGSNATTHNVTVDITDYVNSKLESGKKSFTFMIYTTWNNSAFFFISHPKLYLTMQKSNEKYLINSKNVTGSVYAGETVTATYSITNTGGEELPATVLIALYDNGRIIEASMKEYSLASGETNTNVTASLAMPNLADYRSCKVRVFLWSDTETLMPLCNYEEKNAAQFQQYINYRGGIENTYAKMKTSKTLNVAYIGGSVTVGASAENVNTQSWRALTFAWLANTFPDVAFSQISAGIGGTGTTYGMHRLEKDVLSKNPDLVFVEFAVNDVYDGLTASQSAANYETIIRKILEHNPNCDIIAVYTTDKSRTIAGEFPIVDAQDNVAANYNIPSINIGKALGDYIIEKSGSVATDKFNENWNLYVADIVHPLNAGHSYYADVVKEMLATSLLNSEIDTVVTPKVLGNPISSNLTMTADLIYASAIDPGAGGWVKEANTISSTSAGSTLSFTFSGTAFGLKFTSGANSGALEYSVDGGAFESKSIYNTNGEKDFGMIAENLSEGEHNVVLRIKNDAINPKVGFSSIWIK